MRREKADNKKYYIPKFVSIGPYHFGNSDFQYAEKLKPVFTMRLLDDNVETLKRLFDKLSEPEIVKNLRSFYEESFIKYFRNKEFSKMMLLDSCFILYYIKSSSSECEESNRNQLYFIYQDLFLLENQIPFEVLREVMKLTRMDYLKDNIEWLINDITMVRPKTPKGTWLQNLKVRLSLSCIRNVRSSNGGDENRVNKNNPIILLLLFIISIPRKAKLQSVPTIHIKNGRWNFRTASELVHIGISFKAIKDTSSLKRIEFVKGWWGFTANVKLPPITLYDHTRKMLLNMIAYETYCCSSTDDAWVTSYVCFLDSLIDDVEDVKVLRKAWVIDNNLTSDNEVARLFNEIATDLVPDDLYDEAMFKIQTHCESWSNQRFSKLKNEYFKSPWAIFVLLGALIALFLTGVQTYYTA